MFLPETLERSSCQVARAMNIYLLFEGMGQGVAWNEGCGEAGEVLPGEVCEWGSC